MVESLMDRIKTGMTTVEDAIVVSCLVESLMRYRGALMEIVAHGDKGAAMVALEALRGKPVAAGVHRECE